MGLNVPTNLGDYTRQIRVEGNNFTPLSNLENPRSGSDWNHAVILTFRILLKESGYGDSQFLSAHLKKARNMLGDSDGFRALISILQTKKWNHSPRAELRRSGKEFGSFLNYLDEAIEEQPLFVAPTTSGREKRKTAPVRYPQQSDDEVEPLSEEEEALLPDEEEEQSSSEASQSSDVSHEDQTTIKQQIKSESVINSLIIEYLQSLAQCISDSSRSEEISPRMDYELGQFRVPSTELVNVEYQE